VSTSPSSSSPGGSLNQRVLEVLDRFNAAWKSGTPLPIKSFLPVEGDPDYLDVLVRLIKSELHWSWKRYHAQVEEGKEGVTVEEGFRVEQHYLNDFPCLRDHPEHLRELEKREAEVRRRFGNKPEGQHVLPPGYELLGELGKGGMGVVYRARQVSANRVVALKMILSAGGADPARRDRFRTEAEALARLSHPNIVQVYEVGSHDGTPFFSMELVPGGSLAEKLRDADSPVPPKQAAQMAEALARAVQAAHAAGVVHRDLKPANVLVGDGLEQLKVTDFGLAKLQGADGHLTQTGQVMGTPAFMAPEQAEGGQEVGPPADVYGLGAILYWLLTRRPPVKAATIADVLRAAEPAPVRRLNPKVLPDLETICLKCLRKEPQKRYRSAGELADDLHRFLGHEPIKARRPGYVERLGLWRRRNPWRAHLTAVSLLLLVVAAFAAAGWRLAAASRRAALEEAGRKELEGAYAEARLLLTRLRQLRDGPGGAGAVEEARDLAARFERLRADFTARARALGDRAALLSAPWDDLRHEVRNEVTAWLTAVRLRERQRVPLPAGLECGAPLAVALRSDKGAVAEVAVLAAGSPHVFILAPDGQKRHGLAVPDDLARMAKTTSAVTRRRSLHSVQVTTDTNYPAFHLEYTGPGRLAYQVRQQLVAWDPATGRQTERRELPDHQYPQPLAGRTNAYCGRCTASVDDAGVAVTLRGWAADSRPVVVWRAAGGDPAGGGERVEQLAFGTDGRALFVLSTRRVAVIDTGTGAAAEAVLPDSPFVGARLLVPAPAGSPWWSGRTGRRRGRRNSPTGT
jgi:predicted Ser/Thr protein kinase